MAEPIPRLERTSKEFKRAIGVDQCLDNCTKVSLEWFFYNCSSENRGNGSC